MGGLKAVVYTDAVQMFLLIGGALMVTIFGLEEVGGWNNLSASAGDGFLSLWRSASSNFHGLQFYLVLLFLVYGLVYRSIYCSKSACSQR